MSDVSCSLTSLRYWAGRSEHAEGLSKHTVRNIKYFRKMLQATPPWADWAVIRQIYKRAQGVNKSGTEVHVHHIVPLNSDRVCGLHVQGNLEVVEAGENYRFSNHWWPDMWSMQQEFEFMSEKQLGLPEVSHAAIP